MTKKFIGFLFLLAVAGLAGIGLSAQVGLSSSGGGSISRLSDVNINSVADGQSLVWNAATSRWINSTPAGGGNVTGPVASVDSELALYNGISGTSIKRAAMTGLVLATSGVASAYGGGSCTNQFPRALSASGAFTCASVANADLAGSIAASKLVGTDIATVGTITTGTWSGTTVAVNKGGTGQTTYTDGQLLIGNTSTNGLSKATLTAGANVTITNGNGTITIASTGGGGGGGSAAGVSGAVQYSDGASGFLADDTNFHYDATNKRLELGDRGTTSDACHSTTDGTYKQAFSACELYTGGAASLTSIFGGQIWAFASPSAAIDGAGAQVTGLYTSVNTGNTNANAGMFGVYTDAFNQGNAPINGAFWGVGGIANPTSTGVTYGADVAGGEFYGIGNGTTNVYPSVLGIFSQISLTGGNTFTNASGVKISSPTLISSPTGTALYGLYVDNQTASGFTNAYGIYYNAPSSKQFFVKANGDVTINGTTTAANVNATAYSNNNATPGSPSNGQFWVVCTGSSPSRVCSLVVEDGSAARTLTSYTY